MMDLLDNTSGSTGLSQSGTYSGNPFTLAAGLATLRALTPEVYDHLNGLGDRLRRGLVSVYSRAGIPCRVQGQGSIVKVYFTDQPIVDYRAAATSDRALAQRLGLALLLEGYNAGGGLGLTISSPMETGHVDGYLVAVERVLAQEDVSGTERD